MGAESTKFQLDEESKDPRSASECLLNLINNAPQPEVSEPTTSCENAFDMECERLEPKGFSLNDPRSPKLNRTFVFSNEYFDRTLNLDDTFSDLLVESRATTAENDAQTDTRMNSTFEVGYLPYEAGEETMSFPAVLQHTPLSRQQQFDPLSPTVVGDRTRIIFSEYDEVHEDQMLENTLETLSPNLSCANDEDFTDTYDLQSEIPVPTAAQSDKSDRRRLLEDLFVNEDGNENAVDMNNATSTPKSTAKKDSVANNATGLKRTPHGCVKNRANTRSRSV